MNSMSDWFSNCFAAIFKIIAMFITWLLILLILACCFPDGAPFILVLFLAIVIVCIFVGMLANQIGK